MCDLLIYKLIPNNDKPKAESKTNTKTNNKENKTETKAEKKKPNNKHDKTTSSSSSSSSASSSSQLAVVCFQEAINLLCRVRPVRLFGAVIEVRV